MRIHTSSRRSSNMADATPMHTHILSVTWFTQQDSWSYTYYQWKHTMGWHKASGASS